MVDMPGFVENLHQISEGLEKVSTAREVTSTSSEIAEKVSPIKRFLESKPGKAVSTALRVLGSPAVSTGIKVTMGAIGLAAAVASGAGIAVAAVGLVAAAAVGTYATIQRYRDRREHAKLADEHTCLKKLEEKQPTKNRAIENLKAQGVTLESLGIRDEKSNKIKHPPSKVPLAARVAARVAANKVVSIGLPLAVGIATMNVPLIAVTAATGAVDTTLETINVTKREQAKDNIKADINRMATNNPKYNSVRELRGLTLDKLAEAQALEKLSKQNLAGISKDTIKNIYSDYKHEAREQLKKDNPKLFSDEATRTLSTKEKIMNFIKRVGNALNPFSKTPSIAEYEQKHNSNPTQGPKANSAPSEQKTTLDPKLEQKVQALANSEIKAFQAQQVVSSSNIPAPGTHRDKSQGASR